MIRFPMQALSPVARRGVPLLAALALAACAAPDATAPGTAVSASRAQAADAHGPADAGHGGRESKIHDARGDFLPTYVGHHLGDLDVLSAEVTYDSKHGEFRFTSEAAGPIGLTPTWNYVWGVDRGAGTARFGAIAPGVTFDMVISVAGGIATVRDLAATPATVTVLPASAVEVEGSELTIRVPASLLPSRGRAVEDYTVNLWPRDGSAGNGALADFAPDNSMAPIRLK